MSVFTVARSGVLAFALLSSALSNSAHAIVYARDGEPETLKDALVSPSTEPFSLPTSLIPEGPLRAKWQDVARAIETETRIIADCRTNPETCGSPAALRFISIVNTAAARSGIARLGEVNRAVNLAIRPVSDLAQYGAEDYWSSPLATLTAGAGDCEDYAIAKLVALHEAGVASDDLRLVILRETATGEDHAVLAARFDGHWRLLDNQTFVMIEDVELNKYRPLFAIDTEGVKRFEQTPTATARAKQDTHPASPVTTDARDAAPASAPGIAGDEAVSSDSFSLTPVL